MKKYFLSLVAMAAMLFATSCQESLVEPQVGGTTTFTVQLPDGMGTKAFGEASAVKQLLVEVYPQNDESVLYQTVATGNGQFEVALNLIQDQAYDILFWAQTANGYVAVRGNEAEGYEFDSLREVPMNSNNLNNDNGAAFFHAEKGFVPNGTQTTITLVRPFAQLNLGTTPESLRTDAGVYELVSSAITVTGMANFFNVFSGEGFGNAEATYDFNSQPVPDPNYESLLVANDPYEYVSMNYISVLGNEKALVDIAATIVVRKGNDEKIINHSFTSVPVQENYRTNIIGNLISSTTDFNVVVDADFAKDENGQLYPDNDILVVENAAAAQAALDNAKPGDVIELVAGVNYGTLYLRPVKDSPATKEVDWIGNNYHWETYTLFENITILGAEGATVDAIEIEGGTYYNTEHSQMDKYPVMLSLIELKNVVIDGVTFTGKGGYDPQGYGNAINLSGNNIKVDGLTLKNCVLDNPSNNARLIYKTESTTTEHKYTYDSQTKAPEEYTFTPSLKDITITSTTFNGGYMGLELRETENVTITHNKFNVADRNILLPVNKGCTYSGKILITDNVSNNAQERFVRMSGAGDAEVVIKNNIINNYQGADADYIKVTDGSNVTIENNVLMVTSADDLQSRVNSAAQGLNEFGFANDITGNVTIPQNDKINIVINGLGKKYDGTITVDGSSRSGGSETLVIKNINFEHSGSNLYFVEQNIAQNYPHNVTVEDCTFKGDGTSVIGGIRYRQGFNNVVKNCKAEDLYLFIWTTGGNNITIDNVEGIGYIEGGFSLGQCNEFTVKNSKIVASEPSGYGIRLSASMPSTATIENCEISSFIPVVVREASADQVLTFNGQNTMSASNTDHIWCAIGTSAYNTNGTMPTPATGKVTVVLNDTGLNQAGVYGDYRPPVAKVGNKEYGCIDEAIEAWTNNTTLTLLADVTLSDVVVLKSTEHHILNLGTFTMTAASGKHAIEITCEGRSSASYALTINADATNPGGITATGKSCIYYKKSGSTKDRPIILINNGVFTGSYSINSTSNGNTNCPQIWINGGVFNSYMNLTKNMLKISGGTFHAAINCTGDSSAYREIKGGRFKSWQFMTADAPNKFWVGSGNGNYNVGCYVDDEGYLVVGGPVITEFGDKFAAKATGEWANWKQYDSFYSYLKYSSVAKYDLYYTNAELAIKKHGAANVVLK